ncbi:hypothetical protein P5V15_005983 [Pogonomyrmex californicus]
MRSYLIVLIFLASTALARYHEKTRFDRSIHEYKVEDTKNNNKDESFTDDVTQFVAYKSRKGNDCYLEDIRQKKNASHKRSKILYASITLTKLEAWQLAGGRIVNFCNGRNILLLQTTKPVSARALDPFFNEIPIDENDILPRRVADLILTPLKARTKRQIQLEQREKLNKNINQIRQRRQTNQFRGKFRGQTQSQYLNFANGEQKEGKAEAEATQQSSRAIVSGSRGMGQAQSMSSGGTGCEDCPGYRGIEGAPDKIRVPSPGTDRRPDTEISGITQPKTEGAQITYPGVVPGGTYPSIFPGIYPGGVRPGTVTPGVDGIYPGDVRPGTVTPGIDGTYPDGMRPGTVTPGVDGMYPGGVRPGTVTPGVDGTYPGGVRPGTVTPGVDGIYPGGVRPGTVIPGVDGTYPGGVRPEIVTPGIDGTYPGGVRPGVVSPGGDRIYPSGTLISGQGSYPGIQPGVVSPGVTIGVGTGAGTYPGIQPGGQGTYPPGGIVTTSVTTGATAVTGVGTYPVSTAPGTGLPGGLYPGIPGTGIYPEVPDTTSRTYPGSTISGGVTQGVYPGGGQQIVVFRPKDIPSLPSTGQVPGMITTTTTGTGTQITTYPSGRPTIGQVVYPGPGGTVQPSKIPDGTGSVPITQVTYPSAYPGSGIIPGIYPGGAPQITPGGTLYPGQITYPGGQVPSYPSGQYPGTDIRVPGRTDVPGGIQYPVGQITTGGTGIPGQYPGQYPGAVGVGTGIDTGGTGVPGQYPGQYPVKPYPGMVGTPGTGDASQYYTQTGGSVRPVGPPGMVDDGTESQALSSVQQVDSGTQASASAQGKYGSGIAQSQVTGTYSGSGTFSAQAGTSDANKSAQAEISGGKEGATSNAQGIAGYGKSQTQVQLDSDSGATSTGAQSSGWNHGTNSQVQASSKGGMADAQANGEGSTSSQAQIGFHPYLKNDGEKVEKNATPFRGSGTASAQSGTHRGQSQSQLQGSFQYGITYTGAAQAGSGSGAASSRKPFNFTDTDLFKPFKPDSSLRQPANVDSMQSSPSSNSSNYENRQDESKQNREQGLQSSSTSRQTVILTSKDNPKNTTEKKILATEKPQTDDTAYDEYDDEYADDDDYPTAADPRLTIQEKFSGTFLSPNPNHQKSGKTIQQQSRSQSQTIQVAKGNQYNIHVSQDSNVPRTGDTLQPGKSVSGYTIPPGFRGRVMSTSGTETIAQGDGKSQSQTVSLIPKDANNTKSLTGTRSLQINHERYYVGRHTQNQGSVNQNTSSNKRTRPTPAVAAKPSYYTVTNSFAGKINGNNEPKKYEHRYYTKSSTCGYFTFSCNVVYGSNGRTKICRPKVPTYPDGTPMKC